jgi:SagB-type dehydrogenase family enzyme
MRTVVLALITISLSAQSPLPPAKTKGGPSLAESLKLRKSSREFSPRDLPTNVLSQLLWSAHGVNRPESGGRTAPSAHNKQTVDLYVVTKDGVHLYLPKPHALQLITKDDARKASGTQDFVESAPVNILLIADLARMQEGSPEDKIEWAAVEAGAVSQNIYLYCASSKLATVTRAGADRALLAKMLNLKPTQRIVLAQTVGYPR